MILETNILPLVIRKDGSVSLTADWDAGAYDIKALSFSIGANKLTTSEWAYLDGQDQSLATTDLVEFAKVTVENIVIDDDAIRCSDSLVIAAEDGNDIDITADDDLFLTATNDEINLLAATNIDFKAGGDVDDYIEITTTTHQTELNFVGQNGKISADGGTINFDSCNFTGVGTLGCGAITSTGDLTLPQYIKHTGDADTHIAFTPDVITFTYGGIAVTAANITTNNAKVTESTTVTAPLVLSTYDISIPVATTSADGYLSQTDWDTFNDHITASGASHTYIDQAVTVAGTPQFAQIGIGAAVTTGVGHFINVTFAENFNYGVFGGVVCDRTGIGTPDVYGLNFSARYTPDGPTVNRSCDDLFGARAVAVLQSQDGEDKNIGCDEAVGFYSEVWCIKGAGATGTAIIDDAYLFLGGGFVETNGGTITNAYGLYLPAITAGGTSNWAIYSAGGDSFHTGDLAFGQTDLAERIGSDADGTLDLYAGTSIDLHANTIASGFLRLVQKAGTATDGDLWNDSTQEALQTFVSGIEQTLVGVIFTQTADQTIADTTTETTLFGTGVGTLTLPANFWTVGKTIRIEIHGDFADTGNPTAEIQVYYGATSLIDSGAITLSGLAGTEEWETEVIITCRSTGGSGTVETVIDWEYETTTGSSAIERLDVAGVLRTIDTTASGVLDVTFQWGTAAAANTLHSHVGFVEVLN